MNIALLLLIALIILYFFPLTWIRGYSMLPTLRHGDIIFTRRIFGKKRCKVGRVYTFHPPYDKSRRVIKRLTGVIDGKYFFEGDNIEVSRDSHEYGLVEPEYVISEAKIILYRRKIRDA